MSNQNHTNTAKDTVSTTKYKAVSRARIGTPMLRLELLWNSQTRDAYE